MRCSSLLILRARISNSYDRLTRPFVAGDHVRAIGPARFQFRKIRSHLAALLAPIRA